MNLTKQELEWIKKENKNLKLDNVLDEMNLRARQYCGQGSGISISESQEQAAQDFQSLMDGVYFPLPERTVKDSGYTTFFGKQP
jgi:hypothetical protein